MFPLGRLGILGISQLFHNDSKNRNDQVETRLKIFLSNSKILQKTLINVHGLNVYLFLGVRDVRAQFWEILGYSC